MRRTKKEIKDREVMGAFLRESHVGRLGTVARDGYPMVKPLNFVYHDGKIYFHSAKEGEKIENIRQNSKVCFEIDLPIAYVESGENPCGAEYLYRSVIAKGTASIVDDAGEKISALRLLMEKYQPEGGYGDFPMEKLAITCVVRIDVQEMTGKEDLGKGLLKETALKALQERAVLPITIRNEESLPNG